MESKKRLLEKSRLYVIIDKKICARRPLPALAGKIKSAGARLIQLRDKESEKARLLKDARALRKILPKNRSLFIVNDYVDIAKIIGSDGVHLGQDDISIQIARRILGRDKIIGISCHNLNQALAAQKSGADYIGIGPIFRTSTKEKIRKTLGPGLIKRINGKIKIPFFAIGGIDEKNIQQVKSAGAKRVAVCSAICKAKNVSLATKYLTRSLN